MADELRIASHLTGVVEFTTGVGDDGAAYTAKAQDSIIGAQGGSYIPEYNPTAAIKYTGGKVTANLDDAGAVDPQAVAAALTGATSSGAVPASAIAYYVKVESHTGTNPANVEVKVGTQVHANLGLNEAVLIPLVVGGISNLQLSCANYTAEVTDSAGAVTTAEISATVTVIIAGNAA